MSSKKAHIIPDFDVKRKFGCSKPCEKIVFGEIEFSAIIFGDLLIVLWGTYAFFMVLSVSDDLFSKNICDVFSHISRIMLFIGFYYLLF